MRRYSVADYQKARGLQRISEGELTKRKSSRTATLGKGPAIAKIESVTAFEEAIAEAQEVESSISPGRAFEFVVSESQKSASDTGVGAGAHVIDAVGSKITYSKKRWILTVSPSDFIADVDKAARSVLTYKEYRFYRYTYFEHHPQAATEGLPLVLMRGELEFDYTGTYPTLKARDANEDTRVFLSRETIAGIGVGDEKYMAEYLAELPEIDAAFAKEHDNQIREKLGREFIQRDIYPPAKYLKPKSMEPSQDFITRRGKLK